MSMFEVFILKTRLKFEGEYLNGERNGKGKEYDTNGKLIFEGEFLNGKKWNGNGRQGDHSSYFVYKFIEGKAYFDVTIDNKQYLSIIKKLFSISISFTI